MVIMENEMSRLVRADCTRESVGAFWPLFSSVASSTGSLSPSRIATGDLDDILCDVMCYIHAWLRDGLYHASNMVVSGFGSNSVIDKDEFYPFRDERAEYDEQPIEAASTGAWSMVDGEGLPITPPQEASFHGDDEERESPFTASHDVSFHVEPVPSSFQKGSK